MKRSGDEAFRAIQSLARETASGNTQALLEQFVHERFLARLAESQFARQWVLKGGMLLAVLDLRRETRDADVLVRNFPMDADELASALRQILAIDLEDGVDFDTAEIGSEEIREGANYAGLRFSLDAHVGNAKVKFKLDVSTGDPVESVVVRLPALLDVQQIELYGYPIEGVIAEKLETVISRGDANTRMRDFADLYLIAARHSVEIDSLRAALHATVEHRDGELMPIGDALIDFVALHQVDWTRFLVQVNLVGRLPSSLEEVVEAISDFTDPLFDLDLVGASWSPDTQSWLQQETS